MKTVEQSIGNLSLASITTRTSISYYDRDLYVEKENSIPFILAFIEESGIDKRELINELEDIYKWERIRDCEHSFRVENHRDKGSPIFCCKCTLLKSTVNRIQSKFGDKKGEEK